MEFLVYWTPDDIDRVAREIAGDTVKVNFSQVATGVVSAARSLVGDHLYYKHLLFAREVRDKGDF